MPVMNHGTRAPHDGIAHITLDRTRTVSSLRNRAAWSSALQMLQTASNDDNVDTPVAPRMPPRRAHHTVQDTMRPPRTPLRLPDAMPRLCRRVEEPNDVATGEPQRAYLAAAMCPRGEAPPSVALGETKRGQVEEWLRAIDPRPLIPPELVPVVTFFRRVQEEWAQRQRNAPVATAAPCAVSLGGRDEHQACGVDDVPSLQSPLDVDTMKDSTMTLSGWLECALRPSGSNDNAGQCVATVDEMEAWGDDVPVFASCCQHLHLTMGSATQCDTVPPRQSSTVTLQHQPCSVMASISRSGVPSGTVMRREDTQCGPTPSQQSLRDTRHSYTHSVFLSQPVLCPRTANAERSTSFIEMVHTG